MSDICERLKALLPGLEYSRHTHVLWRDCDQKYRDENKAAGDKEHHIQCIEEYDQRITTIKASVAEVENLISENQRLTEIATKHATRADELHVALEKIMPAVKQYLEYEHNGDPYTEDARSMGEMDLNELDKEGVIEEIFSILHKSKIDAVSNSNDD